MFLAPRVPLSSGLCKLHSISFGPALEKSFLSAKKAIYLSVFVLSFPLSGKTSLVRDLVDILGARALRDGLDVRVSLAFPNRRLSGFSQKTRACYYLDASGVPVRFSLSPLSLHSKICIIDDQRFFIGSHNFYDHSFKNPYESTLECSDSVMGALMADSYRCWWSNLIIFKFIDGVTWPA